MPQLSFNTEVRAQECCAEFRDEFLSSICLCAEAVFEIAVEPLLVSAPVDEFMKLRCFIVLRGREATQVGECDEVLDGTKQARSPPWRMSAPVASTNESTVPSGGGSDIDRSASTPST